MFGISVNKRKNSGTALSLAFYDGADRKSYEVRYESCGLNGYVRVKMQDGYCDKVGLRFKRRISNECFDRMVGHALRNGFFSLKPLYQNDVKDNYRYVVGLEVEGKSHTVVDSFGAAPEWLREFEVMMMDECIEST